MSAERANIIGLPAKDNRGFWRMQRPKLSDYPDLETDAQLPAIISFQSFLCSRPAAPAARGRRSARTAPRIAGRQAGLEALALYHQPDWRKLPGIFWSALRG
jgi:hypothetical protein